VVIDAYTGKMTFYTMDNDPIIRTWERAFPGMFTPASKMSSDLVAHLRYPEDIFTVQAAMYGRYHITQAAAFYNAGDAWNISQSPGAGSPQAALTTFTTNAQGQIVSTGQVQRMAPIYEEMALPGSNVPSFYLLDAFVPVSTNDSIQTLSAFMVAGSDPSNYGDLTVYVTPRGQSLDGPALVDATIQATQSISKEITLLNSNGSSVVLGNVIMVPVGQSMLYFRPLYVQSSRNALPKLEDVIAVYGNQAAMEPTLQAALSDVMQAPVLGSAPSSVGSTGPAGGLSSQAQQLISEEAKLYQQAQADLKAGNLGAYQNDVNQLGNVVQQLQQITSPSSSGSNSSSTSTTTAGGPGSSTTTSSASGHGASTTSTTGSAPGSSQASTRSQSAVAASGAAAGGSGVAGAGGAGAPAPGTASGET
jgi:uncharacterized membrane protein (UPF0182 family)